jgi:hypothetical protein
VGCRSAAQCKSGCSRLAALGNRPSDCDAPSAQLPPWPPSPPPFRSAPHPTPPPTPSNPTGPTARTATAAPRATRPARPSAPTSAAVSRGRCCCRWRCPPVRGSRLVVWRRAPGMWSSEALAWVQRKCPSCEGTDTWCIVARFVGHGECNRGFCKCTEGWWGQDCANRLPSTPWDPGKRTAAATCLCPTATPTARRPCGS